MAKVYDKEGTAFNVVHSIDVQGWIDAGYTLEDPKAKKAPAKAPTKTAEKKG